MNLIINLRRGIGLAVAALALAGCVAKSPGAAPVGDPGFGFSLWSPGRAENAQLEARYAGKTPNNANCFGENLSPALAWAVLQFTTVSGVFAAGGCALLLGWAIAGQLHPQLGVPGALRVRNPSQPDSPR